MNPYRQYLFSIPIVLVFSLFVFAQSEKHPYPKIDLSNAKEYAITDIVDGDTIKVNIDGISQSVRLIGVDTPERGSGASTIVERNNAEVSTKFLERILKGESAYLVPENGSVFTKDRYNRVLAYVFRSPDGLFVNLEIVRQGSGIAYLNYPFQYQALFTFYESKAKVSNKGIWESTQSTPSPKIEQKSSETKETPKAIQVYITKTGSKYHRAGCRYLSKSMILMDLNSAASRYGACSVCSPPVPE